MRLNLKNLALVGLLVLFGANAQANVSLRNGNFFIGYTDLAYSGGFEPKVERVYNSKSAFEGIFGFGWGSDYEAYLTISADGSVVVHENGGGAQNRFTSPTLSSGEVDKSVEQIIEARAKAGAGLSGSRASEEKNRLRHDARYRNDVWEELFAKGLVQSRKIADNTVFRSNKFSFQTLTKVANGYVRKYDTGKVETFDNSGRLVRVADKNGNFINLAYDKSGQMVSIIDNLNRKIALSYNKQGRVEKVMGEGGKWVKYEYNSNNEMTRAIDSEEGKFDYKYSSNNRHNLVEVKYKDNTTLQIGYNDVNKGETVAWVKERDGALNEYEYGGDAIKGDGYYTGVVSKGPDGKTLSKSKYTYWEKSKPDGERYTKKLLSEVDGETTETVYNDNGGLPLEITRNGEKTSFSYDAKGHVTRKETPGEITQLAYDPRTSKIAKVSRTRKMGKSKNSTQWASYQYDERGNLTAAQTSDGKAVKLVYDHTGRIKALIDQNKRRLEFTYNEASRPIEIKDPSVGKIKVQYSPTGEIAKVESSGGRSVASQVTATFQNLLDIIRPAGVTLAF